MASVLVTPGKPRALLCYLPLPAVVWSASGGDAPVLACVETVR